ncbi:hypothetical protein B0H14DRAFT_3023686 [Mycena olivaceomarginata]|nr:hypothetical protein B0H14DRAFT_3023686 [Mycena olivaceomarginata]
MRRLTMMVWLPLTRSYSPCAPAPRVRVSKAEHWVESNNHFSVNCTTSISGKPNVTMAAMQRLTALCQLGRITSSGAQ